ncbi:MAG: Uma2 family endonuclease [Chlorogloea purpurea SAG 13.99]|nr:Uma2 family endonuclease [Chlorogloea purpurea SAG 13.99]
MCYGGDDEICYPESDGAPVAESDPTRNYLFYGVETLKNHFQNREDVYVSGNLFIYYERGVPSAVIAPDVFVIFGVPNTERTVYKAWEENNHLPSFVMEITSRTTKANDQRDKPSIYARLGVSEYFQYDPTCDYLNPPLQASRLVNGVYEPIQPVSLEDGGICIYSEVLGLDLRLLRGDLRFYHPGTDTFYPTYGEIAQRLRLAENARLEAENARLETETALKAAVARLQILGLNLEQIATTLGLSVEKVQSYLTIA